jgi:hypothetical protein
MCTTLICGSEATVDGSIMAAHSSDGNGSGCKSNTNSRCGDSSTEAYPRYIGTERQWENIFLKTVWLKSIRVSTPILFWLVQYI